MDNKILNEWERKENMTVREFIEANFENLIGYTVKIEDYDEYEHFSVKIDFKTNLDNIKDDLSQIYLNSCLTILSLICLIILTRKMFMAN